MFLWLIIALVGGMMAWWALGELGIRDPSRKLGF